MKPDTINITARLGLLLLVAVVLYLTLTPNPPHVALDNLPWGDKIEHCLAFGALATAARLSFPRTRWWYLLEHLSFLGAMIEVAQATPGLGRDCDWHDWVADTTGVLAALGALRLLAPHLGRPASGPAVPHATLH